MKQIAALSVMTIAASGIVACSPAAPQVENVASAATTAPSKPKTPPRDPAYGPSKPATIAISKAVACAVRPDKRVSCWGNDAALLFPQAGGAGLDAKPRLVSKVANAVEVGVGDKHACARLEDGSVWCWGDGTDFLLGSKLEAGPHEPVRVPNVEGAVALSVGKEHTCAVLSTGGLRCWGDPSGGRLGLDHLDHVTEPANVALEGDTFVGVAVTNQTTCARDWTGHVSCWGVGDNFDRNTRQSIKVDDVVDIQGMDYETCVTTRPKGTQKQGGKMVCFGQDAKGREPGDIPSEATDVVLKNNFGCGRIGESISCWGDILHAPYSLAGAHETDVGDDDIRAYGSLDGATEVRVGDATACARTAEGSVECWGDNQLGVLGQNPGGVYPTPVDVSLETKSTGLAIAGEVSCSLGDTGKLQCWGTRWHGTVEASKLENVIQFSIGKNHACAVHQKNKVACWTLGGSGGSQGELGLDAPTKPNPKKKTTKKDEQEFGMIGLLNVGIAEPSFVREVQGLSGARAVAAGDGQSCALTEDGVYCWGSDKTTKTDDFLGVSGPCGYSRDDNACEASKKPKLIKGTKNARALVARGSGFCVLLADGSVACWSKEVLSPIAGLTDIVSLHASAPRSAAYRGYASQSDYVCAISKTGALSCWDESNQIMSSDKVVEPVVQWAGMNMLSWCVLTKAGVAQCYGRGGQGQLGNGKLETSLDLVSVSGITTAVQIAVGDEHACARLVDGTVKCWGSGDAQMNRPDSTLFYSLDPISVELGAP